MFEEFGFNASEDVCNPFVGECLCNSALVLSGCTVERGLKGAVLLAYRVGYSQAARGG